MTVADRPKSKMVKKESNNNSQLFCCLTPRGSLKSLEAKSYSFKEY